MTAGTFKPTGAGVWRKSYDKNDPRAQVFRPLSGGTKAGQARFVDRYILMMKWWANQTKRKGKSHELSYNAIAVAEALLKKCMNWSTGECFPRIDAIMEITGFARPTIVRLLDVLRRLRFLDWVRRTVRTGNPPGEGPQVRQISNAYFFDVSGLPSAALKYLRSLLGAEFELDETPGRNGSGRVPNKAQRALEKLAKSAAMRWAQERGGSSRRERDALAYRIKSAGSDARRAEELYPDKPAEQAEWLAMMVQSASS